MGNEATRFGGPNGNRSGRTVGSKNKITQQFHEACRIADEERGYKHPYLMMAEWANDESKPLEIRAAMLKECAAYRCMKPKQTIGIESEVPVFQSEDQAEQFLAEFISAMAPDLEPAELASMTRQFIISKREGKELDLKANPPKSLPVKVEIVGGLPTPPGYEAVIMPHNGHAIEGHLIAGQHQEKNCGPLEKNSGPQTKDPGP
jgi:hypothetical protein